MTARGCHRQLVTLAGKYWFEAIQVRFEFNVHLRTFHSRVLCLAEGGPAWTWSMHQKHALHMRAGSPLCALPLAGMLDSLLARATVSSRPQTFMSMEAQLGLLNSLSPQPRAGEPVMPVHASPTGANRFIRLPNPDGLVSQPSHPTAPFQQNRTKLDQSDSSWSGHLTPHNSVSDPADLITALNTMAAQQHAILISNFNSKLQSDPVPPMPDVRSTSMLSSNGVFHHNSSQMRFPDVPPPPHNGLSAPFTCPTAMFVGDSRGSGTNGRFARKTDYVMHPSDSRAMQHSGSPQIPGRPTPHGGSGMAEIDHQGELCGMHTMRHTYLISVAVHMQSEAVCDSQILSSRCLVHVGFACSI